MATKEESASQLAEDNPTGSIQEVEDNPTESIQEVKDAPEDEVSDMPTSTPFKTALFLTVLDFFKPLFQQLKESHDYLKTIIEYLEGVWEKLEAFVNKFDSIWDITWVDIYELTVSGRDQVVSFVRNGMDSFKLMFKLWYQSYLAVRESLQDIELLHEYIIPVGEGEELLYPKEARKKSGIRWQCYYMNMNFAYRLVNHLCSFLCHISTYFFEKQSIGVGTVKIEEVKEALESYEKAAKSEGTEMTITTTKSEVEDVQL